MMDFITKVGDTRNALFATLEPAQGIVANIDNVRFRMSDTLHNTLIDRPVDGGVLPEVFVVFTPAEVATAGNYLGEFVAEYTDGSIETFPNDDYIKIQILKNVG